MNVGQTLEELFCEENIDPLEYVYGHSTYIKHAPVIAPEPDDYYIRKWVYSGFFDTRMDTLLRNLGVKTLFCAGFAGDICLLCTMIDAVYRNYRVILLRDCTQAVEIPEVDGTDFAFTKRIVLWAECYLGYTVTSDQFVAACKRAQGASS
jgi:ureidoacrylate peracid hydrolase